MCRAQTDGHLCGFSLSSLWNLHGGWIEGVVWGRGQSLTNKRGRHWERRLHEWLSEPPQDVLNMWKRSQVQKREELPPKHQARLVRREVCYY